MREMSINYPKKEADDAKIKKYLDKYNHELSNKVEKDLKSLTFGDLNISKASGQKTAFCHQFKHLF